MLEIINYNTAPILQLRNATYPFAVTTISNVATLRTTEPSFDGQVVTLLGHTTAGVGSGNFRYDASDTSTADDDGVTIVTSGGKRWKRILNGYVDSDMYGGNAEKVIEGVETKNAIKLLSDFTPTSTILIRSDDTIDCNGFALVNADGIGVLNAAGSESGSWTNLTSNMSAGSNSFVTTLSLSVGDWVFIKSEGVYDDPITSGAPNSRYGQIFQITLKNANTYYTDISAEWDFNTADTAQVIKLNVVENVRIKNLKINRDDYVNHFTIGLNCKYLVNSEIHVSEIIGNKTPYTSDLEGLSAIKFNSCVNVKVINPTFKHIAWYGVEKQGACRQVNVYNIYGHDCRHTVSFNWLDGYGKPIDCHVFDGTADRNSQSGFDTHANSTGRCSFNNMQSHGSLKDSGIQIRSKGITVNYGECNRNFLDGIVGRGVGEPLQLNNITCRGNGRDGVNGQDYGITINNYRMIDNVGSGLEGSSIQASGSCQLEGNAFANRVVIASTDTTRLSKISNQDAPKSTEQPIALFIPTGYNAKRIILDNNYWPGYEEFTLSTGSGNGNNAIPLSNGNNRTHIHASGSELYGNHTFSAGGAQTATITTSAFMNLLSPAGTRGGGQISNVRLQLLSGATGITYGWRPLNSTGGSFEIYVSGDCTVLWQITGI